MVLEVPFELVKLGFKTHSYLTYSFGKLEPKTLFLKKMCLITPGESGKGRLPRRVTFHKKASKVENGTVNKLLK